MPLGEGLLPLGGAATATRWQAERRPTVDLRKGGAVGPGTVAVGRLSKAVYGRPPAVAVEGTGAVLGPARATGGGRTRRARPTRPKDEAAPEARSPAAGARSAANHLQAGAQTGGGHGPIRGFLVLARR